MITSYRAMGGKLIPGRKIYIGDEKKKEMGQSDVLLELEILKWFDPSQYDISYDH